MIKNIADSFQQASSEPIALVFSLVLGIISAGTSVCCTVPALGILIGYSGTRKESSRANAVKSSLYFILGTIIALMIIGSVAGFVGQVAQSALGRYWKLFAGIVAVFLGVAAMKLFPIKISFLDFTNTQRSNRFGVALTGLVLGGIIAACSLPCNPAIFVVIGAAILQGHPVWSMLLMAIYAVGFSIPLGAVLMGVSIGNLSLKVTGINTIIRYGAGIILALAGFYFLITY